MGMVRQKLRVMGDRAGAELEVLFDGGSSHSLINKDVAEGLATPIDLYAQREFVVADGHRVRSGRVVDLAVEIADRPVGLVAYVVEGLPVQLVFGALDMEAYRIKLDIPRRGLDLSEFTGQLFAL